MDGGLIEHPMAAAEREALLPPRLRVLLVVECSGAGTGRHVLDLAEGLIALGCEAHVLCSTRRMDAMFRDRLDRIRQLKWSVVDMRTSIHPSDLLAVWRVRRYMWKHGPFDLIHGHSSKGGACARLAAFGTGVPAYYTMHGLVMMDPTVSVWKRAIYHLIEFGLSLTTRAVVAVSPEEQRFAVAAGLGRKRVRLAPNGVGPFDGASREAARRTVGCDDDRIVFGFVGRLVPLKAPDVLLRSFAQVVRRRPEAKLVIVGDGPLRAALTDLAAKLNIGADVVFLGEFDARLVLASFDVFVMPSRKEGLPYVVLEAMAAGLPIVATRDAGVEMLVESGLNGAVVATDDEAALADAMAELAADADLRRRLGRASKAMAERFTLKAMVDRVLAIYSGDSRGNETADRHSTFDASINAGATA